MQFNFVKNKLAKHSLILIIILLGVWIINITIGHFIIKIISGNNINLLNKITGSNSVQSVNYYISSLDSKVIIIIFSVLFYFFIYKLFKYLLNISSNTPQIESLKNKVSIKYDTLIAVLLYSALTIIFFLPIIRLLSSHLIGPPEDNLQGLWNIWWGYQVYDSSNSLNFSFTKYLFYPEGNTLFYHDFSYLNYFISILLKPISNLVIIYNLLILISFPLAGLSAFALVKYLTKNSYAGLLGGLIFAFSPYHIAHALHHLNLSTIYFIPLFLLFFIKSLKEKRKINILLATLFFLLCTISHWNYFIFNLFFILIAYIYLVLKNKKLFLKVIIYKVLIIVGATLIILSPIIISMLIVGWDNPEIQANVEGHNKHVADIIAYILPYNDHVFLHFNFIENIRGNFTGNPWETMVYLGISIIILLFIYFRKIISQSAIYFGGLIVFLLLSSGVYLHYLGKDLPIILPYYFIRDIPFLASARIPARNIIFVYIFLAILAGFVIKYLYSKTKNKKVFILLFMGIFLIITLDYLYFIKEKTNIIYPSCYQSITAINNENDEFGIINFPLDDQNLPFNYDTRYMLHQTFHEIPIANGYISRKVGSTLIDKVDIKNITNQKKQLQENKIRYVVIHKNLPTSKYLDYAGYKKHYQEICNDSENIIFEVK